MKRRASRSFARLWSWVSAGLGEAQLANAARQYELPTPATLSAAAASFVSLLPPNETISMINGPAPDGYPIVNYEYAIVTTRQPTAAKAQALQAFFGTGLSPRGTRPSFSIRCGSSRCRPPS